MNEAPNKGIHWEDLFNRAIKVFGRSSQLTKAIEECGELIQVLAKDLNHNPHLVREQIIDEIADVSICLAQMKIIYKCHSAVYERINYKVHRMKNVLDKLTNAQNEQKEGEGNV